MSVPYSLITARTSLQRLLWPHLGRRVCVRQNDFVVAATGAAVWGWTSGEGPPRAVILLVNTRGQSCSMGGCWLVVRWFVAVCGGSS